MGTDRLTDSLDRPWAPGTVLGRGTWGRSRIIRDPQGREAVLKEPLTEADFPSDAPLPDELLAACRLCARQQVELLHESEPYLPRLEATVELGGGRVGLVLPRYSTLQRRLERGVSLGDVLQLMHRVVCILADAGRVHGNLRPSNIVFGERDQPFLADLCTPALTPHHVRLMELADARHWMPPEARSRPSARWDTWALCQILHGAILVEPASDDRPAPLPLAQGGLDKVALATLKDAAHAKLSAEGSNPRFRGRVTDRIGALLSRGLSASFEPSPPYRFSTARDLADRLAEILALLHPRVVEVGRILLPATAADGVFQSGSELSFTVTVGCTQGINDHEDIVCGLQLVDLDAAGDQRRPVDDTKLVVQVHPSGRLRFQLSLPAVPPGRYRVRVAFAVKDSGLEPQVATGEFEVRPPPGYVPPRLEPERAPLPFPHREAQASPSAAARADAGRTPAPSSARQAPPATSPGADTRSVPSAVERRSGVREASSPGSSSFSEPGDAPSASNVVPGPFPRPVAPPQDEVESGPSRARGRRPDAGTDATVPEPGVWPPVAPAVDRRDGRVDPQISVDEPVDTDGRPVTLPPTPTPAPSGRPGGLDRDDTRPGSARIEPPSNGVGLMLEETGSWPGRAPVDTPPRHAVAPVPRSPPRPPPPTWADADGYASGPAAARRSEHLHRPNTTGARPAPRPPLPDRSLPDLSPEQTDDLPEVASAKPTDAWWGRSSVVARVFDAVRRDSYVAVGAAVAASLILVLVTSALLKAC